MVDEIPDESGAGRMALDQLNEIELVTSSISPVVAFALAPRFERARTAIKTLDSVLASHLRDESRRIDELRQEADLSDQAREDAELRARIDALNAYAEAGGQGALLPPEPPAHDL